MSEAMTQAKGGDWVIVDATSLGYPGEKRWYNPKTGEYRLSKDGWFNPAGGKGSPSDMRILGNAFPALEDWLLQGTRKQSRDARTTPTNDNTKSPKKNITPINNTIQPLRRPLRDADPLPKTLAEAYKILGPEPVGDTTLGRLIGTPNNSGFIELTPEMQQEIAGVWSDDMMSPTNVVPYDKSIFEGTPVAFSPSEVPVSFDYGDLKLTSGINDHVMPGLTPKTGLQALRADEKSQGLLYASGKYWAENADGKLEAIPTDLINGEGTARQQAIAFMQNKMRPIVGAMQIGGQQGGDNSTNNVVNNFKSIKLP